VKSIFGKRTYTTEELGEYTRAVIAGGGKFVAVMDCAPYSEDLVLFDSPTTHSTLALPLSQFSAQGVRARIAASDAEFAKHAGEGN